MRDSAVCYSSRALIVLLLILLSATLCQSPHAAPNEPSGPMAVKDAIVVVLVKGILPQHGNSPVSGQGTGFFISKYGFLVTSYHLRTDLGAVDEGSVTYEVHFGVLPSDTIMPASVIFANPAADIMVLSVPVGQRDISTLRPSTIPLNQIYPGSTVVLTGGYPQGYMTFQSTAA